MYLTISNLNSNPIVFGNKIIKTSPKMMESIAGTHFRNFNVHIDNAGTLRDFILGGSEKFDPKTTIDTGAEFIEGINTIRAYFNVSNGCMPVASARVSAQVDNPSVTPENVMSELFRNMQNLVLGDRKNLIADKAEPNSDKLII